MRESARQRPAERGRTPPAVGCDVGGTEIKAAAIVGAEISALARRSTPRRGTGDVIEAMVEVIREVLRDGGGEPSRPPSTRPAAVGVALPGFLDADRSRPIHLSNLPALDGAPLRSLLARRFRCPVILDADSNAGAAGEGLLGAGRGARRLLYLALGTGVGAALLTDGEPVRVSNHTVGQVAHLPLDPDGPRCPCGALGCVESVLGARGIAWRASRAARRGAALPPAVRRSPRELVEAARGGSEPAREVLAETGVFLGTILSLLANLFSPDRIVVGGGIAAAGDLLLFPAGDELAWRVHPRLRAGLELRAASLAPFSGAVGAALLARRAADHGR